MSNRFEPRRSFNPTDFEHPIGAPRDASDPLPYSMDAGPSSSADYPYYDRYVPPRAGPSYRGDMSYTNTYRGDSWRPERATSYYRPPSPERYPPARYARPETRPRPSRWVPDDSPPRVDRRLPPNPSYDNNLPPPPRDSRDVMAERMFEPSDSWKQTHAPASDHWGSPNSRDIRGQRRMSPPPYSNPNDRSWRRTPSPPPVTHWDAPEPIRPSGAVYPPLNRSPSDRMYRLGYWDSSKQSPDYSKTTFDDFGQAPIEYRRGQLSDHVAPRPTKPQVNETDERPFLRSPTRTYNTISPNTAPRREAYWPESATTPDMRSPREHKFPRANTWGYHSRTPSDSYSPGSRHEITPMWRENQRTNRRRESNPAVLSGPWPSSTEWTIPTSRSSSRSSRPNELSQREKVLSEPAATLTTEGEHDSLASTPREDRLSRAPSPDPSSTLPTVEVNSQVPPEDERPPAPSILAPSDSPAAASPPALRDFSSTPPPGIFLDHEPIAAVAQAAVVAEVPPPTVPAVPDSLVPSESGTPIPEAGDFDSSIKGHEYVTDTPPAVQTHDVFDEVSAPAHGKTFRDTLRILVMMRLRGSRQTREERVNAVLSANEAIASSQSSQASEVPDARPPIVEECMQSTRAEARHTAHLIVKPSLQARFAQRQADLNDKVAHLRDEYLDLHERWLSHCARLDGVAKAGALEEAAASAGRTTRRSLATLGDAVRSDLEMEQIIASLGNEELTDANHLAARNAAVIPDMVTVEPGGLEYYYDDTNNLVDNPDEFYAPQTGFFDWTAQEKAIFLEKYAEHPKQFGIIASFLPYKTAAQCVTYYYLQKKDIDFRKVVAHFTHGKRRRGGRGAGKKRGNALLSDILQRDAEFSREHTPVTATGRRTKPVVGVGSEANAPKRTTVRRTLEVTPTSTPTPDPEPEARRKRRRVTTARAAAALEQEAEIDDAVDLDQKPAKRGRRPRRVKTTDSTAASTPVIPSEEVLSSSETRVVEQTEGTSRKKFTPANVAWSAEDKGQLISLLGRYGDDFKRIAASMSSKTTAQITAFYKANMVEMKLDKVVASAADRSPTPELSRAHYRQTAFPGSGILTPDPQASNTPPEGVQGGSAGQIMETRFRVNGTSAPRGRTIHDVTGEAGPNTYHFRPTSVETMQAQYHGQPGSQPTLQHGPPPASMLNVRSSLAATPHFIANPSPFASPSIPSTLTTTFPSSFPYTNLSPSHFSNGVNGHAGPPPPAVNGTASTVIDSRVDQGFSHAHPPPVWGHQLHSAGRPGGLS